ncbi:MAG TPA: hypothetical protein VG826_33680 [Pirellulales bacterium]|nr:hypothetical protein [Pirellulales bacterium]
MSASSGELQREDIVGKRVAAVLQSPWLSFGDISACAVYVLLDNGVLFELASPETAKLSPSVVPLDSLRPADLSNAPPPCTGEVVQAVLVSDCWPLLGLLLSSNRFLYCSDDYSPKNVGACLAPVGERYGWDDVRAFWEPRRGAAGC